MTLGEFNNLGKDEATLKLFQCCGSIHWASVLMNDFPFVSEEVLVEKATDAWYDKCNAGDWLEAFSHHPLIGDKTSLQDKFAGKEQASVMTASDKVIEALANANHAYLKQFQFVFIVCATGKSAEEMLRLLNDRLGNSRAEELNIAMGEQHKITLIRFKKLLDNANFQFLQMSQLTTHVLDTSLGKPGKDMTIRLMQQLENSWQTISQGITNADGRISDLLPEEKKLTPGNYKLVFETGNYFAANSLKGFYPEVEIQFTVAGDEHYHVPLLINPFGYSTYRGS